MQLIWKDMLTYSFLKKFYIIIKAYFPFKIITK